MHPTFLERPWAQMTRWVSGKMELFSSGSLGKVPHDSLAGKVWRLQFWMARECGNHWVHGWPGALFYVRSMEEPTKLIDAGSSTNLNVWGFQPDLILFSEVKNLTVFAPKYCGMKQIHVKMVEFRDQNKNQSRNEPFGGWGKSGFFFFFLFNVCMAIYVAITCESLHTKISIHGPGRVAQSVGMSSCQPKGHGLDPWPGHISRLWVQFPAGVHIGGSSQCFSLISLSLSLPSPRSKTNKHILRWG